jgi:hypothetical protein
MILSYAYHVIFGAGNASQIIDKVAFWPRSTFVSVSECVMLSGAVKEQKVMTGCLNSDWDG